MLPNGDFDSKDVTHVVKWIAEEGSLLSDAAQLYSWCSVLVETHLDDMLSVTEVEWPALNPHQAHGAASSSDQVS